MLLSFTLGGLKMLDPHIDSSASTIVDIAWSCEKEQGRTFLTAGIDVNDVIECLVKGKLGNLADPKVALKLASQWLGPKAVEGELKEQTARLTAVGARLAVVGALVLVWASVQAVRQALLSTWGTASDQLQTAILNGGGTSIIVTLSLPRLSDPYNDADNRLGWTLTTAGLGPLRIGLSGADGVKLGVAVRGPWPACPDPAVVYHDSGRLSGARGAYTVWGQHGTLEVIRVSSPSFATQGGIRVGDTEARLRTTYAAQLHDGEESGHSRLPIIRDGSNYLEFNVYQGVVNDIFVGSGQPANIGTGDC